MGSLTREEMDTGKKAYTGEQYVENAYKRNNMILNRPQGWIIMDTWNNKVFPIRDYQVDTMTFNSSRISDFFHEYYGGSKRDLFLPWHFIVEMVDGKPMVISTRPFTYKSGFKGYENYLTIMIIGDSNKDIYTGKFYKQMAHLIMNQFKFLKSYHIHNEKSDIIYWTGTNFKDYELEKELY
jgi:hypothetical protein